MNYEACINGISPILLIIMSGIIWYIGEEKNSNF